MITSSTPEALLKRYLTTRDNKFLALLIKQFNHSLYHYLLTLSDKELAEDVVQITWLKVLNIKNTSHEHTNVRAWLYTIARNTLFDELRKTQRWHYVVLDETQHASTNALTEKDDRLAAFNSALMHLPFYQREAFIFQQEGFSILEIAEMTNESFETIKSRLRYARKQLKTILGKDHE